MATEIKLILDTGTLEGAIRDLIGAIRELSGNTITPAEGTETPLEVARNAAKETLLAADPETKPEPTKTEAKVEAATPEEPECSIADLSRAGAALIDQGKMPDLIDLLARYGVQAVTQLKPESYPAFLSELRALGAQI